MRGYFDTTAPPDTMMKHFDTAAPAFASRSSTPIMMLSRHATRKMRKSGNAMFWAILGPVCLPFFLMMWWPIGIVCIIVAIYEWYKWFEIARSAHTNPIREARCPYCTRQIHFWVETGFSCPYCNHLLMQDGMRLYDIDPHAVKQQG